MNENQTIGPVFPSFLPRQAELNLKTFCLDCLTWVPTDSAAVAIKCSNISMAGNDTILLLLHLSLIFQTSVNENHE